MTTAELVATSRAAQGLEPKVADATTLARLAVLLTPTRNEKGRARRDLARPFDGGRDAARRPSP